jgi:hypothetical protein
MSIHGNVLWEMMSERLIYRYVIWHPGYNESTCWLTFYWHSVQLWVQSTHWWETHHSSIWSLHFPNNQVLPVIIWIRICVRCARMTSWSHQDSWIQLNVNRDVKLVWKVLSWCMKFCYEYFCYIQTQNIRIYRTSGNSILWCESD